MKVKAPLHSEDARGKFGTGVVFGKGQGTNWARELVATPVPLSLPEVITHNLLSQGARAWSGLAGSQRTAWDAYALTIDRIDVFGNTYHASGQNEYIACYSLALRAGGNQSGDSPAGSPPPVVAGFLASQLPEAPDVILLYWDEPGVPEWVEFLISKVKTYGQASYRDEYFLHEFYDYDDFGAGFVVDNYQAKYSWKCRTVRANGQWGPWLEGILAMYAP